MLLRMLTEALGIWFLKSKSPANVDLRVGGNDLLGLFAGRMPGFAKATQGKPAVLHKLIVLQGKCVQAVGMSQRLLALCRCGFYLSVLLVIYGALFPFHFDISSFAWSHLSLVPFWDVERGRIHSLPDMLSNILLTVPLGFFGSMYFGSPGIWRSAVKWFFIGLGLGLLAEVIQLAVPSRVSDITDALNNGFGSLAGAAAAQLFGTQIIDLLSGQTLDRRQTYFLILVGIVTAGSLLPFDFGLDVSHIGSTVKQLLRNPWESGIPIQDEWIQMAEFIMIGAIAGLIRKPRVILLALGLPFILEAMQFLVESHAPSGRDVAMNLAGAAAGLAAARIVPALVQPGTGFLAMNLAIVAQGLSPYRFGARSPFEWIPLVEYYNQTTGAALYDALTGILTYGLLVALRPRKTSILWAIALASSIEVTQMSVIGRYAGTTDILIAGIGGFVGYSVSKNVQEADLVRL
jgi:glycopeptide antibiotics resistance protein